MKFIRALISDYFTQMAHEILPHAVGDVWSNPKFTVLFPGAGITLTTIEKTDDMIEWDIVAGFSGECWIRIMTDQDSPIDPLPLVAYLLKNPLVVAPSKNTTAIPEDKFGLQFTFKPTGFSDLISDDDGGVISCIQGEIVEGYLLKRSPYNTFKPEDVEVAFLPNSNPNYPI